ncbi:MAG TPA: sulfotransferase domain-containing protein [Anaerolineales bacterium]|nr:sulfotransferase domain-containing protein [Anaerolineales bacterium]
MELDLDIPDSASQWYKLRKNPRLFFWWLFHRATTALRVLPDFLVIGVMKGGTTSFFNYLAMHPQINPPFRKEIKFFDIHYSRGLGWYRAHFPLRFKMGPGMITGEATPYYIFHPCAPNRIEKDMLEKGLRVEKLIALLRNPVDRAYSHYNHMVRVGREPLSFEEAIKQEAYRLIGEEERIIADPHYSTFKHLHYSYLARGRYVEQLEKWFKLFPREMMLILPSEELYTSPATAYRKATEFLGLADWIPSDFKAYKQGVYEEMPISIRKHLIDYYRPYNQRLYDCLNRKFDWDK